MFYLDELEAAKVKALWALLRKQVIYLSQGTWSVG